MNARNIPALIVLLLVAMTIAACGGNPAPPTLEGSSDDADGGALSGEIIADGSSTVFPITTAVAEEFQVQHPDVRISVGLSGTGSGFEMFCTGRTDVQNASRAITESETEQCAASGVEWTEFLVAQDGLTVIVNPENDWVDHLTQNQLAALFAGDSDVTTWADLNPDWPAEEIRFFIPDPGFGAHDTMRQALKNISGAAELRQDENTIFSGNDSALLDDIASERHAIGFLSYATYTRSPNRVKPLAVENDAGQFVLPDSETVQDGSYNPLSHPLFIYSNNERVRTKTQVATFMRFYFAESAEIVMADAAYSPPPAGTYGINLELVSAILAGFAPTGTRVEMGLSAEGEEPVGTIEALSGDVIADGSSTVYPVTTAVAEEFNDVYPDVRISVGLSGTGGGFKKFCAGETDISDASRPIKETEAQDCASSSVEWTEFTVALDGLTIMVNPENDWVDRLTQEQLARLFTDNSDVTTWADLNPGWPDEEILFFIPDPDSGTRDYLTEVVVEHIQGREEGDLRQDENTTFSSDDNVLLDGIANERYAIGFFGYAYYSSNSHMVQALAIENDSGEFVLPSDETVQNGSYNPLSRPLFIYTNNQSVRSKPQVAEFVRFYFAEGALTVMEGVGYSVPSAGIYEENLAELDAILSGRAAGLNVRRWALLLRPHHNARRAM